MKLNIPYHNNNKLETILKLVRKSDRLEAFWECSNINAIDRLKLNDHGPIHVAIVSNIALKILRNLIEAGVVPSVVKDHKMTNEDAEIVVVMAALLHDVGIAVHRDNHVLYSIPIALDFLKEFLPPVYSEKDAAIITAEVLHAIIAHEATNKALSVEAGIIRVADALDMKQGRARIPFSEGHVSIHSVSAMSIQEVEITKGDRPVVINITMTNSAGIFQIDNLLTSKLRGSGLEDYIRIKAEVKGEEKKILDKFEVRSC